MGDAPALFLLLLFRVIGGQVRRDPGPAVAPVRAPVHKLTSEIDGVVVKGILRQCRIPVETELLLTFGHRPDALAPPCGHIYSLQ